MGKTRHPGWVGWYNGLSRKDKIRYWVGKWGNDWDDWLVDRPDWISERDWLYYFDGGWGRFLCWLVGHNPIPDHCGIPEHDYCSTCQKPTPRQAPRTA